MVCCGARIGIGLGERFWGLNWMFNRFSIDASRCPPFENLIMLRANCDGTLVPCFPPSPPF